MKTAIELLPGALHIPLPRFSDARGSFVKTHQEVALNGLGIEFKLAEEFYSISHKDVIRGMHFQLPPDDHDKIVYCPRGRILDVLLDLRAGVNYGQVRSVELDSEKPAILFIPRGIAHGFKSLTDDSLMVYKTSTEYAPQSDAGIHFQSIGFDWQCEYPIVSDRDNGHPSFESFSTPFGLGK